MEPGKAEVLREGEPGGVAIWALGHLVSEALAAAEVMAKEGVQVAVIDARFVKPLDEELLAAHLRAFRNVITIEAHQRMGGFGSAVLEVASRLPEGDGLARVRILGLPDRYLDHATTPEEQLRQVGLDGAGLVRQVRALLGGSRVK
jgi:1-deoxy-D-xylulose-5-phosphate synthase